MDGVLLIKYEMKIKKHKFIYKIKMYVHRNKAIMLQCKKMYQGSMYESLDEVWEGLKNN